MNSISRQPQLIISVKHEEQILGYLVVDTFVDRRSHGGIRMHQQVTEEEVRRLAKTMTWKYAFLGLPFGGAKAGILGDPDAQIAVRREKMSRFGRAIEPLLRDEMFVPAADMGTDLADIREMLASTGISYERKRLPAVSSGLYTAHSVLAGARALAKVQGRSLQGMRVVIDGFGKVGSELARLLSDDGAHIVAVTTSQGALYAPYGLDVTLLRSAYEQAGSKFVLSSNEGQRINREGLWQLPMDVLFPCAQIHCIDASIASKIQASIVCPAANNPWTMEVEGIFDARGIAYWPEFVVNNGGILGTAMTYMAFTHDEIVQFMELEYGRVFDVLLEQAAKNDLSIRDVSEALAEKHYERSVAGTSSKVLHVLISMGLGLHRRGLLPGFMVRWYAERYFRDKLCFGLPSEAVHAS